MSIKGFVLCSSVLVVGLCGCGGGGPEPVVTGEEFKKIQTGMTLQEVEAIIGAKGEFTGENKNDPKVVVKGYQWVNPDNSNMYCNFINDKMETKVKIGFR